MTTTTRRRRGTFAVVVTLSFLVVGGCGDDGDFGRAADGQLDGSDEAAEFSDAVHEAIGAGGGGTLVWDGTEHPIDSVLCANQGSAVDVGTVGDDFRVLISGDEPPYNIQVLDDESVQWFVERDDEGIRAALERSNGTFTGSGTFFRADDPGVTREASFVVECP